MGDILKALALGIALIVCFVVGLALSAVLFPLISFLAVFAIAWFLIKLFKEDDTPEEEPPP